MIEEINPILPGWVNYFAVRHSSRCFSFIKLWVEKKIRRHLLRARGVGKEPDGMSLSGIGLIALHMKQAGKPSAGKQHAGFDAAGRETSLRFGY